jgi:hypothetical protein
MGHFVRLDDESLVVDSIVVSNDVLGEPTLTFPDTEAAGRAFIANTLRIAGQWRQTSYSGSFRKRFAAQGFLFDADKDQFVPPNWILRNGEWVAPNEQPIQVAP